MEVEFFCRCQTRVDRDPINTYAFIGEASLETFHLHPNIIFCAFGKNAFYLLTTQGKTLNAFPVIRLFEKAVCTFLVRLMGNTDVMSHHMK